ncbi:hypothetical protein ACE939_10740 [Aquimarina sp. W85]|uniref:hypothetical protein n=1 Tax=Aquimarina rhodophyticola TaxID=3342246 RepID=UPI00366EE6A7
MKKHHLIITILFIATQSLTAQWTKGKNKGYYKLSAWSLTADQHYTDTGEIDPNATRGQFNVSFYGEYGISNKIDIIAYIPFFARAYQNDQISGTTGATIQKGEAINSVGDSDIGIRYAILKRDNIAISTTLKLGIPIGEDAGGSDKSFQTGDGEFNQLLQADLGIPFTIKNIPLYAKTFIGFNNRTEDFSDELHAGAEIGCSFLKQKIWLIGRFNTVQSLQNGSKSAQNSQGSIFANNIEYTSVGGEIAYYFTKKLGFSLTYTSAINGRIIYANPSISGGIFLDIK